MGLFSWLFGSGKNKQNSAALDAYYKDTQSKNNSLWGNIYGGLGDARNKDNTLWNDLYSGYKGFGDKYGNVENNPSTSYYRNFANTGGIDPSDRSRYESNYGNFEGLQSFGKNLTETGGFTDADKANFRARGNSVVPAYFDSLKTSLGAQNAAQGGYNPGYTSQLSKMARDRAHEGQTASRDTELGLSDAIMKNKEAGAGIWDNATRGLSDAEMSLMQLIAQGKEFGTSGLASNNDQAMRAAGLGLSGEQNLYSSTPGASSQVIQQLLASLGLSNQTAGGMNSKLEGDRQNNLSWIDRLMGAGSSALKGFGGGGAGDLIFKLFGAGI